ncbi:neuroglobin-like [Phymastichus coffea]|uniref:neuroglobin-like n=1 Tax=Phymastichus coffea TaxID=108790 RepID=UPI00273B25FE|nr:neuroglobin-like [Phymastichus coffea]
MRLMIASSERKIYVWGGPRASFTNRMGCKLSKLATSAISQAQATGNSNRDSPPPPPKTDPRLPLTARQKYLLTASWKAIVKAMEPTGIYMFVKLFEENTDVISFFDKMKHLRTKEERSSSTELADHAQKVMNALDEGIQCLDDMDIFLTFLHQIGATHSRIPGFNRELFWKIELPFLAAMQMTLHDRFTDNVENIYKLTIKFIIETLIEGFDEAQAKNKCTGNKL